MAAIKFDPEFWDWAAYVVIAIASCAALWYTWRKLTEPLDPPLTHCGACGNLIEQSWEEHERAEDIREDFELDPAESVTICWECWDKIKPRTHVEGEP